MSICVARLITCARQLLFVSNQKEEAREWTNLIFLFFHSYFVPVAVFRRAASSFIIVKLLLALLQVMWLTFAILPMSYNQGKCWQIGCTYFVLNSYLFDDFEESVAKLSTIVCVVEPCEANQSVLEFPLGRCWLLDPVCCDSKIAVCIITCLPRIRVTG